jgi:hypothetical protein
MYLTSRWWNFMPKISRIGGVDIHRWFQMFGYIEMRFKIAYKVASLYCFIHYHVRYIYLLYKYKCYIEFLATEI